VSTPLRAFLLLRSDGGEWQVEVWRDLEDLLRAWEKHFNTGLVTGVVHVGFERSLARCFENLARQFPHRMLLTAAAKHALPRNFLASTAAVGEVEGQAVYLAIRGWGYEAEDITPTICEKTSTVDFKDWVRSFVNEHSAIAGHLAEAGVIDEATYLKIEGSLGLETRKHLGLVRYRALIQNDENDPCAVARVAPPWLRERAFETMDLRVRIANVFHASQIRKVADLGDYSLPQLLKLPNFGRTSVADLLSALNDAIQAGPLDVVRRVEAVKDVGLLQAVRKSLHALGTRERDILSRRMGLNGPTETLSEIGESYGVTRERIRQIEAKTLAQLFKDEIWDDLLTEKLSVLLKNREFPLPMLGVEAIDTWFDGIATTTSAFRYILSNMPANSVGLVEIDGMIYLTFLNQQRWEAILSEARGLLSAGTEEVWTEQHCRSVVHALLPEDAAEFRALLWEKATALCHFSSDDAGGNILRSYGRGAEQIVEAVLQDTERPLHYSEIFERVTARSKKEFDIRRVHNAAASVGYLFGRGTFGLVKHLPFNQQDLVALADQAEAIISDGPPDRQWHTTELLITLIEAGSSQAVVADKYVLDAALHRSGALQSLGRLVWMQHVPNVSAQARIDIRQAVVSIVRQAGRPLKATEIRQRLVAVRGLSEHVQISTYPPLIRMGPSLWGLLDRDVALIPAKQIEFVDALAALLARRGVGLHASEIWIALTPIPELSTEAALSLASLDDRMRISVGQYIYLEVWGEPRCETVSVAVKAVLRGLEAPTPFHEIATLVQERIGRRCEHSAVSGYLQALGASLDEGGLWSLGEVEADDSSEVDVAA
jgi:hypothetical protein